MDHLEYSQPSASDISSSHWDTTESQNSSGTVTKIFSPSNDSSFFTDLRAALISISSSLGEKTEDAFFALNGLKENAVKEDLEFSSFHCTQVK